MSALPDLAGVARAFAARRRAAAIVTDFDGTLAPIVADPASARPLHGTVDVLHALAESYAHVAVVSGRPVAFLAERLELDARPGSPLVVAGLYGLERWDHGTVALAPPATQWAPIVRDAVDAARRAHLDGAAVEDKGLSVTLHYRTAPAAETAVRAWVEAEARRTGLVVHAARQSLELRPPIAIDKGTVVADLVAGAGAACFLGDDVGDLPAFDALDRLQAAPSGAHAGEAADVGAAGGAAAGGAAAAGAATTETTVVRVGVRSAEAPAELLARADVVVDGPAGALAFLEALLGAARAQPRDA